MSARLTTPATWRSRLALVAVALATLGAAVPAGAQVERLASSPQFDAATRERLVRVVESARDRGLPVDPLVDKALEGAIKHAPAARIEGAVSALLQRLETSREMLAPHPTEADIVSGADALAVGVPREALRSLRTIRPNRPVAVPLAVLAQLVAQGVPVARASVMVEQLVRRGAREEQLVALNSAVQADVAAGFSPEAALDIRTRALTPFLAPAGGAGAVNTAATIKPADHP